MIKTCWTGPFHTGYEFTQVPCEQNMMVNILNWILLRFCGNVWSAEESHWWIWCGQYHKVECKEIRYEYRVYHASQSSMVMEWEIISEPLYWVLGVKDLGIIGQCSGLMYLDLSENRITDLRPLGITQKAFWIKETSKRLLEMLKTGSWELWHLKQRAELKVFR